jgi:hypothetical protein
VICIDPVIPGRVAKGKAPVSAWLFSAWTACPDLSYEVVGGVAAGRIADGRADQ